jgi:membrane protein DedA with SNARE-associated domain
MNLPSFIQPLIEQHALLSFFAFLLLFGFTLPISEEVALALVGVAARASSKSIFTALLVAYPALLIADFGYYALARSVGPRLLRSKLFSRLVKPQSVLEGERYFEQRGPRILFICRFVVGLRAPAIVAAGLLRMRFRRFVLYDFSAVLLSTPIWLGVGYALGAQFDSEVNTVGKIVAFAGPIAVLTCAFFIYRSIRNDKAMLLDNGPDSSAGDTKEEKEA